LASTRGSGSWAQLIQKCPNNFLKREIKALLKGANCFPQNQLKTANVSIY